MNCSRPLHEIARYSGPNNTNRTSYPAHTLDDVYMPSDVAARLFPPDGYHDGERVVWDLTALGGDRRSRAH